MGKGDFIPGALLRPLHLGVRIQPDGSVGATAGLVGDVLNPETGTVLASARNFELDLSAAEQDSLRELADRLARAGVEAEGLAGVQRPAEAQASQG